MPVSSPWRYRQKHSQVCTLDGRVPETFKRIHQFRTRFIKWLSTERERTLCLPMLRDELYAAMSSDVQC